MLEFINTSYSPFASSVSAGFPTPPSSPFVRPLSSPPALSSSSGFLQKVSDRLEHQPLVNNHPHSSPILSSDDIPSSLTSQNPVLVTPAPILSNNVETGTQPDDTPPALAIENPIIVSPSPFIVPTDIAIDPNTQTHNGAFSGILEDFSTRDHEGADHLSDHILDQQMPSMEPTSLPDFRDFPVFDLSVGDHEDHNQNPANRIIATNDEQTLKTSDPISEEQISIRKTTDKSKRKTKKARPAYEVAGRLPRPPNSWILYRSEKISEMKSLDLGLAQSILSKEIAARWREEPSEVKKMYERRAEIIKAEHAAKHPDYKYNPKRHKKNGEKSPNTSNQLSFGEEDKGRNKQLSKGKPQPNDLNRVNLKQERTYFNVPPTPKNSISTSTGIKEEENQIRKNLDEDQRVQSLVLDANLYKAFPVLSQLIANQNPNTPLPSASTETFSTSSPMTIPSQFQDLTLSSNQGILDHHQHVDPQLPSATSWPPLWQPSNSSTIPIDYPDSRSWNRNMSYPLPSIPSDHNFNRYSLGSQLQWTPNLVPPNPQQYSNPNYNHHQSQLFDGTHTTNDVDNNLNWQDPRLSNWSNSLNLGSSSNNPVRRNINDHIDSNGINFGFNSFINDDSNHHHQLLNQTFWNLGNQ